MINCVLCHGVLLAMISPMRLLAEFGHPGRCDEFPLVSLFPFLHSTELNLRVGSGSHDIQRSSLAKDGEDEQEF